ncbi:MAG: hypothetical protein OXB84_06140 [Halobacteriovoraceae bacterium]|nr:hypothetical protein [Halobacteriovoraceae bacterium]
MSLKINFDKPLDFKPKNFMNLKNVCGLYLIFLPKRKISYPFGDSRLIYIGMSEKVTNSISSRLIGHFEGKTGNFGLKNYRSTDSLSFTYINFEAVKSFWPQRIEDFESVFILDFVENYGVYPICNNKTGFPELSKELENLLSIDWSYFN